MSKRKNDRRRQLPGSVFARGRKWAFKFYGPPHPLTGIREVVNRGGFETEDDAWDAMRIAQTQVVEGTYTAPSKATVAEFFERWFKSLSTTTAPTTAANYENLALAYVLPVIGKRQARDLGPEMISALYDHLLTQGRRKTTTSNWAMFQHWRAANGDTTARELAQVGGISYAGARLALRRYEAGRFPQKPTTGLARKSILSVHIMLGPAMKAAKVWGYVSTNPMPHVTAPSVERRTHTTWTAEEMARFLDAARKDRWYALMVLVATTGMRRSELCGLKWPAVDLEDQVVRMNTTRVIAGPAVHEGTGKSGRSRRRISLDDFTTAVLREHQNRNEEERQAHGSGYHDHGLVFCWDDGRPIYPDTIRERFSRIVDRAGLPPITFHDVRHSYATLALRSGVHPKIVSSRLGHATVAFTLDTYSADVPDLDREAAKAISALFIRPAGQDDGPPGTGHAAV